MFISPKIVGREEGVRCGNHKSSVFYHESAAMVRECYAASREDRPACDYVRHAGLHYSVRAAAFKAGDLANEILNDAREAEANRPVEPFAAMAAMAPLSVTQSEEADNAPAPLTDSPCVPQWREGYFVVELTDFHGRSYHKVLRIVRQEADAKFMPGKLLVGVRMTTPERKRVWGSFGHITSGGKVRVWKNWRDDRELAQAVEALQASFEGAHERFVQMASVDAEILNMCRCLNPTCGRLLSDPESIRRGKGPVCAKK